MFSQTERILRDRRLVWCQAKALADTAAGQNRAFTAEEPAAWDLLNAQLDHLDRRLKAVLSLNARADDRRGPSLSLKGDYSWQPVINYRRRDPVPVLPAGCWHLVAF
jgi:hypothetical protein